MPAQCDDAHDPDKNDEQDRLDGSAMGRSQAAAASHSTEANSAYRQNELASCI